MINERTGTTKETWIANTYNVEDKNDVLGESG
jgi:hypothetical protein